MPADKTEQIPSCSMWTIGTHQQAHFSMSFPKSPLASPGWISWRSKQMTGTKRFAPSQWLEARRFLHSVARALLQTVSCTLYTNHQWIVHFCGRFFEFLFHGFLYQVLKSFTQARVEKSEEKLSEVSEMVGRSQREISDSRHKTAEWHTAINSVRVPYACRILLHSFRRKFN